MILIYNQRVEKYENETDQNGAVTTITYPITWPTTPSPGPPVFSYSPQLNFSLTTQLYLFPLSKVGFPAHGDDSTTNLSAPRPNPKDKYNILWISLAAAAIVFTLVGFAILFVQRYINVVNC